MLSDCTKTIVVVPCYNEQDRLDTECFLRFSAENGLAFLFVNDCSCDGTALLLESLKEKAPGRIQILHLKENKGKAEAVRLGIRSALETTDAGLFAFWDADLATPLDAIPLFLEHLNRNPETAMVIGARIQRLGARVRRSPLRHYLGRIFATMASMYLHLAVYDTQCGAKMMRRNLAEEITAEPFRTRWLFDLELLERIAERNGLEQLKRIVFEYPLPVWEDRRKSKIRPGAVLKDFAALLTKKKPGH